MLLFRVGDLLRLAASAGRPERPAILPVPHSNSSSLEKAIGVDRTAGGSVYGSSSSRSDWGSSRLQHYSLSSLQQPVLGSSQI